MAKTLELPPKYVMFSTKSSTHMINDTDIFFLVSNSEKIFGAAFLIWATVVGKAGVFESPVMVSCFDS